ncbi:MAG: hypothetical protein V3S70_08615, partial [Gammaproteobacteria bacterium]
LCRKYSWTSPRKHDLCHEDGSINCSAFHRVTGIPIPTVSRIMNGDPDWAISSRTAESLMAAFSISFEQARGDKPVSGRRDLKPTARELNLVAHIRSLPPAVRSNLETYIEQSAVISKKKKV